MSCCVHAVTSHRILCFHNFSRNKSHVSASRGIGNLVVGSHCPHVVSVFQSVHVTARPVSVVVAKSCFVRPSASTSNKTFRAAPDQQDPEVWFCPQMMHGECYQMPGNRHKAKMRGFGAPPLQPTRLGRLRTADPCISGRFALLGQPPLIRQCQRQLTGRLCYGKYPPDISLPTKDRGLTLSNPWEK